MFAFARNQELKTHTTPVPALLIMLEDSCMFEMEDNITKLAAGEVIEIPAQIPHSLKAASNFKMLLIK